MLLQCRDCRQNGASQELDEPLCISDACLTSVPLLPRCSCFLRMHRGKLPANVQSVITHLPEMGAWADHESLVGACPPSNADADAFPQSESHRLIYSVDGLPAQRDVSVYFCGASNSNECLGTVVVTAEHKISDLLRTVVATLKVKPSARMYRGVDGEKLKVPLHERQHRLLAMPFFPSDEHHLIVVDA
jgi:hypothetical protein